jgi:hypothetical protein
VANNLDITSEDLALTYEEELEEGKQEWYDQKIDEAVRLLIVKVPSVSMRVASGDLDIDFVKDVVLRAVMRVVRNPAGVDSVSEGGVSIGLTGSAARGGEIRFYDNEIALVAPKVVNRKPQRVQTVQLSRWW